MLGSVGVIIGAILNTLIGTTVADPLARWVCAVVWHIHEILSRE